MKISSNYQLLFFLFTIFIFNSCKKDDKSALLYTDSHQLYMNNNEKIKFIEITNMGDSDLSYSISTQDNYLSASPSSGSLNSKQKAQISVTADFSNLDEGITRGLIRMKSNGGNQNIDVQIEKIQPLLSIDSLTLNVEYYQDSDSIIVTNNSTDTLYYQLSSSASWISYDNNLLRILPLAKNTIELFFDRSNLSNDTYSDILNIEYNNEKIEVIVNINVGGPPYLFIINDNLTYPNNQTIDTLKIKNSGSDTLIYQINSTSNWISFSKETGRIHPDGIDEIEVIIDKTGLSNGSYSGLVNVTSNGGNKDLRINFDVLGPPILYWDVDYLKINNNSDRDYIIVRNDGAENLSYQLNTSSSWMTFSQTSGDLVPGQEEVIWVIADRTGLANNLYLGEVIINSNGGTGYVDIDMEVGVYSVSFYNPTSTDIDINVPGEGSKIIPVLDRVNYVYPSNPGNLTYQASTAGETVNNVTLGLFISWQDNISLSGENSPIFDLNISEEIFFLSAINYGSHDLDNWSINNGTDYQFDEDVSIPNDGFEYYFGYYDAFDDTKIYARIFGTDNDALWENGHEFDFPWAINQSILLESSLKSTVANPTREFKSHKSGTGSLKMKNTTRTKQRARNSKSLVNKK